MLETLQRKSDEGLNERSFMFMQESEAVSVSGHDSSRNIPDMLLMAYFCKAVL